MAGKKIDKRNLGDKEYLIALIATVLAIWVATVTLWPVERMAQGWYFLIALALTVFAVLCYRYFIVLLHADDPKGSSGRDAYQELRSRIAGGGKLTESYSAAVTHALGWTDRFFGDAGRETPPLWTAASYDRSLLIALLYPLLMIALFWTWSGQVGDAESALLMDRDVAFEVRVIAFLTLALCGYSVFIALRAPSQSKLWLGLAFCFIGVNVASALGMGVAVFVFAAAFTGAFAVATNFAAAFANVGAFAVGFGVAFAVGGAGAHAGSGAGVFAITFAIAFALMFALMWCRERNVWGRGLLLFTLFYGSICFALPWFFGGRDAWAEASPLFYFLVLLTLVNAPFDWLALGATRLLLRLGMKKGGWWPLLMGIADMLLSLIIIMLLAIAAVWATQAYNAATIAGGGKPFLPVCETLNTLSASPFSALPQYWWMAAMLFSTQFYSLGNVALGALSVVRGVPLINGWLGRVMREDGELVLNECALAAFVLSLQLVLSCLLACALVIGLLYFTLVGLDVFVGGNFVAWLPVVVGCK